MTLTSTQFQAPTTISAGTVDLVAVPAGHRYLVRGVAIVNQSTTADGVLSLFLNGTAAGQRLARRTIVAGTDQQLDPWWVLNPGDVLKATRVTSDMTVSVYGYDLLI